MPARLIGVDCGATHVRAWHVERLGAGRYRAAEPPVRARLAPAGAESAAFAPLDQQQAERDRPHLSEPERAEAARRVELAADAIAELVAARSAAPAARAPTPHAGSRGPKSPHPTPSATRTSAAQAWTIGLCWPGLKDAAGRGVLVAKNGPRSPHLLDELERALCARGLELAAPLAPLRSDGECCGLGEELGSGGALADVAAGYYLGGGTGCAECLKLEGVIASFDRPASPRKAWQLECAEGVSFEDAIAPGRVNQRWREQCERLGLPLEAALPETAAAMGEFAARQLLQQQAQALALLVYLRLIELAEGAGEQRAPAWIERVVLGQRLGEMWEREELGPLLRGPAEALLGELLSTRAPQRLRELWLDGGRLREGVWVASKLAGAAAIGAAVLAEREASAL